MKTDFNTNNLVRLNIRNLKPYSSARDDYKTITDNMVFLDANENPFENGVNRYPDPQQKRLKTQLSEIKNIREDQLLLGNGSDEILDLIFRAFCEPNKDNVITLPPTYGMYEVLANMNAIEVMKIELDSNFEPKISEILKAENTNTKLLLLCSPNNPTANSFATRNIEYLITNFKGIVVIDEAYIDFSNKKSWLERLNEFPNLIITQTFSKAYGMAGVRLGVCYSSKAIVSILNKIKPPYNINELTQQKVYERLLNLETVSKDIQNILKQRDYLSLQLKSFSFVKHVFPTDANFILVKVDDANRRYSQLITKGIVVRNRTNQLLCDNCLRFTIGSPTENKKLITALKTL